YVVDTPGLRELGTWGIDPERLGVYFAEFQPFLDECRFDNCRHLAEPGCGVRQAAERGAFDPDRLVSYQRIYEEVSVPSWSSGRRRGRLPAIVNAELPPLVAPFRGERYTARELSALIAPPYDVISHEDRTRYAARDLHNIVHLILPEAPSGGGGDRYAHAATLLATWR